MNKLRRLRQGSDLQIPDVPDFLIKTNVPPRSSRPLREPFVRIFLTGLQDTPDAVGDSPRGHRGTELCRVRMG